MEQSKHTPGDQFGNKVLNIEIWNCHLKNLVYLLFSHCKSSHMGGFSFGVIEVVSNHSPLVKNQQWTLNGKQIEPHFDLTDEQFLEIYYRMESHRINNIKASIEKASKHIK